MKTRPRHLVTALAALAGMSAPTAANIMPIHAAPTASIAASSAALKTTQSPRRHLPFFNFETPKNPFRAKIFKHSSLSQRQRRKFNRQRNAAGIKNAFN